MLPLGHGPNSYRKALLHLHVRLRLPEQIDKLARVQFTTHEESKETGVLPGNVRGETLQRASDVFPKSACLSKEGSYGRDELEDPISVEVVPPRGSCIYVDVDPMATGLCVELRIYDDRVLDKSTQRVRRQIRWENPSEHGNVTEGAVDLEVICSEVGREVSHSVDLDPGIKFHVEQDCLFLGESFVEFEFDADFAVFRETDVTYEAQPSDVRSKASMKDSFMN